MKSVLSVWWDGKIAGELRLDAHGDMSFVYCADWLEDPTRRAISISLAKREKPYGRRECRPFFAGLLPEESVRDMVAAALGISRGNDFELLKALGGDVAGALTLWLKGEEPPRYDELVATKPLGDNALIELLDKLPKRPFLAGQNGLRLSLAGAQTKLPVVLVNGRIALPAPGQPTTHILKPPIARFPATTENEAFVMRLAADVGLSVAAAMPCKIRDRMYLLVTRYDRTTDPDKKIRRLHQEDFCQALGIPPERKYASEGGPTFKSGFELLRNAAARPAVEVLKLLDAAIFNLIAGNADAHGKNFSLLYGPEDTVLAPLYDLMCTAAYPDLTTKPAMKIADASSPKDFTTRTWQKFAEDTKIGATFVRRRVRELALAVHSHAETAAETVAEQGFDNAPISRFAAIVQERAETVGASA